jgi:hypothetical protein
MRAVASGLPGALLATPSWCLKQAYAQTSVRAFTIGGYPPRNLVKEFDLKRCHVTIVVIGGPFKTFCDVCAGFYAGVKAILPHSPHGG